MCLVLQPASLSPRIRKPKNDRQTSLFVAFSCSSLGASDFSVGYTSATPAAATLAALSEIGSEVKMDLQFMHFHVKRERSRKERGLKREQVRGEGREEKDKWQRERGKNYFIISQTPWPVAPQAQP